MNDYPCQRQQSLPTSRREMLTRCGSGFGAVALTALQSDSAFSAGTPKTPERGFAGHGPHHEVRAKNVIFLYMDGGISQVDSFDPKPQLAKDQGKKAPFKTDPTVFNSKGGLLPSPWEFQQHGESGLPLSSLFPHLGTCADDL